MSTQNFKTTNRLYYRIEFDNDGVAISDGQINVLAPDIFAGLTVEQIVERYGEFDRSSIDETTGRGHAEYEVRSSYTYIHAEPFVRIWFGENGVARHGEYYADWV